MSDPTGDDQQRRMELDAIGWEYRRLSEEARDELRLAVSITAFFAVVAGAGVAVAFQNWDKPLISAGIINLVLPFVLFSSVTWAANAVFWERRKREYIWEVLENKANALLGSSSGHPAAATVQTLEDSETSHTGLSLSPAETAWATLRRQALGWDHWEHSQDFMRCFGFQLRCAVIFILLFGVLAFVVVAFFGLFRVLSDEGWTIPLSDPRRFGFLISQFLLFALSMASLGLIWIPDVAARRKELSDQVAR